MPLKRDQHRVAQDSAWGYLISSLPMEALSKSSTPKRPGKFQAGRGASKARPPGVRASSRHVHLAVALISLPCTSSTQAAARERQEGRRALGWESLVATSEGGNTAAKLAGAYLDK